MALRVGSPGGSTSPPGNGVTGRVDAGFTTPLFGMVVSLHAVAATPRHNARTIATTASTAVHRTARPLFMAPRSRIPAYGRGRNGDRDADRSPGIAYLAAVTEIVEIVSHSEEQTASR